MHHPKMPSSLPTEHWHELHPPSSLRVWMTPCSFVSDQTCQQSHQWPNWSLAAAVAAGTDRIVALCTNARQFAAANVRTGEAGMRRRAHRWTHFRQTRGLYPHRNAPRGLVWSLANRLASVTPGGTGPRLSGVNYRLEAFRTGDPGGWRDTSRVPDAGSVSPDAERFKIW